MSDPTTEPGPDERQAMTREAFDVRLRALNARREAERDAEAKSREPDRSGWGQAFRMSSDFIAAIVVGALIGYGIDWLFGTLPWGLIVFFLFGFAAAILNVLRASGGAPRSRLNLAAVERANGDATTTPHPPKDRPGG